MAHNPSLPFAFATLPWEQEDRSKLTIPRQAAQLDSIQGRHESSNHLSHAYAHTVNNASTSPNLVPHPETNEYMAYRDNSNTILGRSEFLRLNQPFHVWSAQGDSLPALRSPAGDELLDLGWPEAELLYAFPYAEETQRMERFQDFPNPSQESGEEHQASAPSWARSPFLNDLSISDGFNTLHHNQMILDNPRMPVFERTELQFQTDTSHSSNRDGLTKKERRLLPSQSPCDVDGDSDCKITGSRKIPAILEGDSDCEIVGSRKVKKAIETPKKEQERVSSNLFSAANQKVYRKILPKGKTPEEKVTKGNGRARA